MNTQRGFTLIELVMVIVILGILAATALPKFADLSGNANQAAVAGARGAVASAMAISHAAFLINSGTTNIEGTPVTFVNGYPNIDSIDDLAGLSLGPTADFQSATAAGPPAVLTVSKSNCSFTYTEATTTAAAIVSVVTCT